MKKDYEVGQVFEVVAKNILGVLVKIGDLAVLVTKSGKFEMLSGKIKGNSQYDSRFQDFKRIYPPEVEVIEELPKDVIITCEGKETTISRESAEKLNLI